MNTIFILFYAFLFVSFIYIVQTYLNEKKKTPAKKTERILSSTTMAKGVDVDVLKEGNGPQAVSGKCVQVHYTAWLEDGTKVDSSRDKGEAFTFTLGRRQVIPGWEVGMMGMKVGEKRKFTIAPEQAYGDTGKANVPPNATIIFQVELLKVV